MTILTIKIPESKASDVSNYIKTLGGEVVTNKKAKIEEEDDDEVTHERYFGENLRRAFKALTHK